MTWTVDHREHGIAISGPIPSDMDAIVTLGKNRNYDLVDALLSGHLPGVTMVLVNAKSGNAWRTQLGLEANLTPPAPPKERLPVDPPFRMDASQDDRTILKFSRYVNDPLEPYVAAVEGMLEVKGVGRLVHIDLTECRTLTGDWARWLNTVAERYPKTEVWLGEHPHHRTSFEARELEHLLGRICG